MSIKKNKKKPMTILEGNAGYLPPKFDYPNTMPYVKGITQVDPHSILLKPISKDSLTRKKS